MRKGRFPADPPLVTSFSRDEGLTHLLFRAAVAERLKVFVENGEQAVGFRVVDARERREADDGPVFNGGGRNEPACGPEDALQMLERERVGRMKEGEYVRATRILLETGSKPSLIMPAASFSAAARQDVSRTAEPPSLSRASSAACRAETA